jgi:hypothetical protein
MTIETSFLRFSRKQRNMSIKNYWTDDRKEILVSVFEDQWTWDQYYLNLDEIHTMLGSVDHLVDYVLDLRMSAGFPPGNVMSHMRYAAAQFRTKNVGNIAIAGSNMYVRMIFDMFRRIYRSNLPTGNTFVVKDLDEAQAVFAKYRQQMAATSGS